MDWTQSLTIIGVNIALIGIVCTLVVWAVNKLDADVKSIGNRLDSHAQRIDQLYHQFNSTLKQSSERTDRLYQMFYDLLKERK